MVDALPSIGPVRSAAELFPKLLAEAGLTGRKNSNAGRYDRGLLDQLKSELFPNASASESLNALIGRSSLSAEALLRALFATLEPFSRMKQDILAMLADAGAGGSGEAIAIRFDPGDGREPLDLSLAQFRSEMETISESVIERPAIPLNADLLWELVRYNGGIDLAQHGDAGITADLRAWLERRKAGKAYEALPDDIFTGGPSGSPQFVRAAGIVNHALEGLARLDARRRQESPVPLDSSADPSGLTFEDVSRLENDYWSRTAARWIADRRQDVIERNADRLTAMNLRIDQLIPADAERRAVTVLTSQIEDILNLPVWKYRSDVYAVWLGAQIHQALRARGWQFRFHLQDGRLRFSFGGVHLATLVHPIEPDTLFWWTELRTSFGGLLSRFRKSAIQPDYCIQRAPISVADPDILVVEAKQHLASKSDEFRSALGDYARVCPNAQVLLANYGPISASVLARIEPVLARRTHAFARIHPGEPAAVAHFHKTIGAAIGGTVPEPEQRPLAVQEVAGFTSPVTVELSWSENGIDLDLYIVRVRDGQTANYQHREVENVSIDHDARSGPATETAVIRPCADCYRIVAHRHTIRGDTFDTFAKLRLVFGAEAAMKPIVLHAEPSRPGRWWFAATIDMLTRAIEVFNCFDEYKPR